MTTNLAVSLTQTTIYLMGASFVIGSLFTILILIFLDFISLSRNGAFNKDEDVVLPTRDED